MLVCGLMWAGCPLSTRRRSRGDPPGRAGGRAPRL